MKHWLLLSGAVCFLFAATSCKDSASASGKVRIGVSIPAADHGWTGGVISAAEDAAKRFAEEFPQYEFIISTAQNSAEQVDKIENMMVQGAKALVILPHEPEPLTNVSAEAKRRGLFLVTVDRGLIRPVQDVYVAGDNAGFGRTAAQAIAQKLEGQGDILIMEGIPCVVNTDRVEAFKAEIAQHPGIRILGSQTANWDTEQGLKVMENFLQKHNKIDAVWVGDDDVLIGALKALAESKRSDVKLMLGGGGAKAIVKRVMDGDPVVGMTVTYPPRMIETGMLAAIRGLENGGVAEQAEIIMPSEVVTSENAADYYFPASSY